MKEYRLYGDGRTDNTAALQELLDMKGTLVLFKGVYMTGPLTVHEDTRIEFEEGAVLKFIPDFSLYGPVYTRWEGVKCHCMHPCLYIDGARNVSITGKGTIDGSGQAWWDQANLRRNAADGPQTDIERMFASLNPGYEDQPGGGGGRQVQFLRPPLVQIHESSGVTIEGLTIVDSPFWTIHPVFSDHIVLRDLRIENPADAPNTDGIDIESCTDVVVESCFVHVGDDGIALKSGSGRSGIEDAAPTSRVAIRGCTVKAAHGGAVIGSETAAGIDHIEVSDCIFDGTDRGIRIKSRRGRGGSIHDLVFRNLTMNDNQREDPRLPFLRRFTEPGAGVVQRHVPRPARDRPAWNKAALRREPRAGERACRRRRTGDRDGGLRFFHHVLVDMNRARRDDCRALVFT